MLYSLEEEEEKKTIGGFDLIFNGKNVSLPNESIYTTMLGCRCNRT